MEDKPLVECKNVTLVLNGKKVLENISFSLKYGQDLVVLGPNGAGKTLLLSVLSGNLLPTEGDVLIFGKPLYTKEGFYSKKQIGFVSPKLFDDYEFSSKVPDIVMSGLFGSIGIANDPSKNNNKIVQGYITRVISDKYNGQEKAFALLNKLEIAYLKDEVFGQLSYGEKVRVLIARSLINNPQLFILDEPTSGLDLKTRAEFAYVIRHLCTISEIIYVTHHLEEIPEQFKRVLFLKDGRVFDFGNKENLLTEEKLSALFNTKVYLHRKNGKYLALF